MPGARRDAILDGLAADPAEGHAEDLHLASVLRPVGAAVVITGAFEETDSRRPVPGSDGCQRTPQSGLLIVGQATPGETAHRHLIVAALVFVVTFGSRGSNAGWLFCAGSLPPA